MVLDCLRVVVDVFEVVVGGFRLFHVVPCFSNYDFETTPPYAERRESRFA